MILVCLNFCDVKETSCGFDVPRFRGYHILYVLKSNYLISKKNLLKKICLFRLNKINLIIYCKL